MIHTSPSRKPTLQLFLRTAILVMTGAAGLAKAKVTTVEYRKIENESLLLDVCVPEEPAEAARPVVIVVHGGGWGSGDRKTDIKSVLKTLSEAGYLYVSMDYRLRPKHRWPACREDVDAAVEWTKTRISEYGGDPDRIAILGYSAGGQLAFWSAIRDQPPHKLKGLIGLAPTTDLLEDLGRRGKPREDMRDFMNCGEDQPFEKFLLSMYEASPINYLHGTLPPILLIHGSEDMSVPFQQSFHVKRRIEDNDWKVPCEIYRIEGAPHRQTEWDKFDSGYHEKLVEWLQTNL